MITAAAPFIPPRLIDQLKIGGKMVLPLETEAGSQRMLRLTKTADGKFAEEEFEQFKFVPMLKGKKLASFKGFVNQLLHGLC